MVRTASLTRETRETKIDIEINIDGTGKSRVSTGIGFFDHMLTLFTVQGFFELTLTVQGDLEVDYHHTVEDTGLVLGQAISKALGDRPPAVQERWGGLPRSAPNPPLRF